MTKQYKIVMYDVVVNGVNDPFYKIYSKEVVTKKDIALFLINWILTLGSAGAYIFIFAIYCLIMSLVFNSKSKRWRVFYPFSKWQYQSTHRDWWNANERLERLKALSLRGINP